VSRSFLATFLATVAVLTFIISIGGLFKITDLLAKGIAAGPILQVFLSGLPNGMVYAIPVGTLTAALLVFGRLSGDCEITAMRACGISMQRVASWLLPFSLAASLVCLYVNSELMPLQHYIRWRATSTLRADSALQLLEVGRTVSLDETLQVFVGAMETNGTLTQIRIFDQREAGRIREIKAERGMLENDTETGSVWLLLENVTIDPFQFDSPGAAYSERWRIELAQQARRVYRQRDKHQNFHDLYVSSRALELEADRLAESRRLQARSHALRQEAYMRAEAQRLAAWETWQRVRADALRQRARADGLQAADTAHALRQRAGNLVAAADAAYQRALGDALAIEQAAMPMVAVLVRQSRALAAGAGESEERLRMRAMEMRIVFNQRLLLSFSPMLFLFFGIPMGIRPHRRETSVGIASSLAVMFLFYIVLTLFGEFKGHPQLRPDRLVWIPGVLLAGADMILLRRLR